MPAAQSPILVLGTRDEWVFLIDGRGQFRALRAKDFSRRAIVDLAVPGEEWLCETFPGGRDGFDVIAARAWIFAATAGRPLVDPQRYGFDVMLRGRHWIWGHANAVMRHVSGNLR